MNCMTTSQTVNSKMMSLKLENCQKTLEFKQNKLKHEMQHNWKSLKQFNTKILQG